MCMFRLKRGDRMRPAKVISVVNRRGGAGKTVTASNIGIGLAIRNYKVLFIDLDSQGNLSYDLGVNEIKAPILDVLAEDRNLEEAIVKTRAADIAPSSASLANANKIIQGRGQEYRLEEAIEPIKYEYDYIIIDTAPALDILTVNALTASDSVIIPAQAEVHSLQGIGLLYQAIEAVKAYSNHSLKIEGILITRYDRRTILSKDMRANIEETAEKMKTKVFKTAIRENVSIKEAQAVRTNIFFYAPNSNGAKDYNAVIDELLENS